MSLLEVMIAVAIFAITATVATRALIGARYLSEKSVHKATVNTVVFGYLEQIATMQYSEVLQNPIPTRRENGTDDRLHVGTWNYRTVDINNTPNDAADDMPVEVFPTVREHAGTLATDIPHIEVRLDYRWFPPTLRANGVSEDQRGKWLSSSVNFIRSPIQAL